MAINCIFVLESESIRDAAKREANQLSNKMADYNENARVKEKDLQLAVDDAKRNEMKAAEKVKNLENLLDNLNQVCYFVVDAA